MKKTRAGQNTPKKPKNTGKIEKIYYVVIGLLIVILGGLVIFIFANRDDAITDSEQDTAPDSELITDNGEDTETEEEPEEDAATDTDEEAEEPADETDEDTESEVTDEDEAEEDTDTETDTADEDAETEDETEEDVDETAEEDVSDEDTEEADTDDTDINANAPLDESYNINFGDGSSDRNAIEQNASAVSGINQGSMITWWVGNNGPGRAFTVVSDSDRNTVYRVELQYGEGTWHVTRAQELDGVPAEYR